MPENLNESGRIFPPWAELNSLRTPLTNGERALAQFLDDNLPASWRIYVQPYINNMRPDVVVVNPYVGLVVFEVKDWELSRYHFREGKLVATTATNMWIEEDPVKKAQWYAKSLFEQFLVSDEAVLPIGLHPNSRATSRPAVYFHCASTQSVQNLYQGRAGDVIKAGYDLQTIPGLRQLVPYYHLQRSQFIRDAQVTALDNIHSWLAPPKHALSQVRTTQLVTGQAPYAKPGKGCRRIRGVAGAGKSFVLSHRAARANAEGRKIALLCFNITMSHILRDLLKQAPYDVTWSNVTWAHFHAFVIGLGIDAGLIISDVSETEDVYSGSSPPSKQESTPIDPVWVLNQIHAGKHTPQFKAPTFGGIYIDEGQDFDPRWIDALSPMLSEGGELVLFADHRQNIYGRDGGCDKTKAMKNCRFGKWAQLPRKSFRIPERIALFLNHFAATVEVGDEEDLAIEDFAVPEPISGLPLDVLAWHNIASVESALESLDSALSTLGNPNPGDVVVLMPDHKSGLRAVSLLQDRYPQIVHVFGDGGPDSPESRRRKMAFWMGRGGLKMSTIHSFKGWELENVILIWPPSDELSYLNTRQQAALFYTGVSRAMRNMIVLNCNRSYDRFSAGWEPLKLPPPIVATIFDDDIPF